MQNSKSLTFTCAVSMNELCDRWISETNEILSDELKNELMHLKKRKVLDFFPFLSNLIRDFFLYYVYTKEFIFHEVL